MKRFLGIVLIAAMVLVPASAFAAPGNSGNGGNNGGGSSGGSGSSNGTSNSGGVGGGGGSNSGAGGGNGGQGSSGGHGGGESQGGGSSSGGASGSAGSSGSGGSDGGSSGDNHTIVQGDLVKPGQRAGTYFLTPAQEYTWDVFRACKDAQNLMVTLGQLKTNGGFSFTYSGTNHNMRYLIACMERYGFVFEQPLTNPNYAPSPYTPVDNAIQAFKADCPDRRGEFCAPRPRQS